MDVHLNHKSQKDNLMLHETINIKHSEKKENPLKNKESNQINKTKQNSEERRNEVTKSARKDAMS